MSGLESTHGDGIRTRQGQLVGTPVYMSPEQANGEGVTTASDMYSFGLAAADRFHGDGCRIPRI